MHTDGIKRYTIINKELRIFYIHTITINGNTTIVLDCVSTTGRFLNNQPDGRSAKLIYT